jgi:hypothetical protein
MKPLHKAGVVVGGYIASAIIAVAAVTARNATIDPAVALASSGMYAFGDLMLFVAVFGVCALVPTGAMLYFARPYATVWNVLSVTSVIVAITGVMSAIVYAIGRNETDSVLGMLATASVLRILIAPLLALAFAVCAVIVVDRTPRRRLFAASAMEAAVSVYAAIVWFAPLLFERR